jgi:5S rRNA maturation endonuclease (ribonuclease M5)
MINMLKAYAPPNRFVNRWGKLRQVHAPNSLFHDETLELTAPSVAVLLVFLQLNKGRPLKDDQPLATVRIGQKSLAERTGYSKNVITKAIAELEVKLFIKCMGDNRKKYGEFGTNEYLLCNPADGEPLPAARNVYLNKKIGYFTVPAVVVTEITTKWSLAHMSGSDLRLYTSILYLANRKLSNEFTATAVELRKLSGLAPRTLKKAIEGLRDRGLVYVIGVKDYRVQLCDPFTGAPLEDQTGVDEDDPANYYMAGEGGRSKRLNLNAGDAARIETLVRSCLPIDELVIEQGNGDLTICCPFHADSTPSCSVSPKKNGCFHCFGCNKIGSLHTLIAELKGITKGEAIEQTATALGIKAEFHEPDKNAIAKYHYRDAKGKLLKQVFRYPNNENGKKVFQQRRPAKGGALIWNTTGLPPMLFNMELLDCAGVVCITEGEKDASTVTELQLLGDYMMVIGMTSGGADSWDSSLAKHLHDKKVVLMPDADEAGARFAASVKASLDAEGIEYHVVSFSGTGAKDVTDYLAEHTVEQLVRHIGVDWVRMPNGRRVEPSVETSLPTPEMFSNIDESMRGDIVI